MNLEFSFNRKGSSGYLFYYDNESSVLIRSKKFLDLLISYQDVYSFG